MSEGQAVYTSRDEAIWVIVAEAVETELRAGRPFTALDISNRLKTRAFPIRHGEAAAAVRDLYARGAFRSYGFDRELIEVNTEGGTLVTQAFLYLHDRAKPSDYAQRIQDALPPLADSDARSLMTYIPAACPTLLSASAPLPRGQRRRSTGTRGKHRRDGALPIPKRLAAQAGWQVGDVLTLAGGPNTDDLRLVPTASATATSVTVRVWAGLRVRVAKTKLCAVLQAAFDATQAVVTMENGALRIAVG